MTNQADVLASLALYGFELCLPHDLTLAEQIQLFSESEYIVGTGTGLANMLYAPAGALVLQVQEPSKTFHALWTLSEALGHKYWFLMCKARPNPQATLSDIEVPIDRLAKRWN